MDFGFGHHLHARVPRARSRSAHCEMLLMRFYHSERRAIKTPTFPAPRERRHAQRPYRSLMRSISGDNFWRRPVSVSKQVGLVVIGGHQVEQQDANAEGLGARDPLPELLE